MANSINPKYKDVCENEQNPSFCKYCEGTSGLPREKEEKYLEIRLKQFNNELPSIPRRILNLATAVAQHISNGIKITDEETLNKRLSICNDCDKYIPQKDSCSECGCQMRVKCSWAEQKCPLGKW